MTALSWWLTTRLRRILACGFYEVEVTYDGFEWALIGYRFGAVDDPNNTYGLGVDTKLRRAVRKAYATAQLVSSRDHRE